MNIIQSISEFFNEKGIVKGTQEILDAAVAVVVVSTVACVAVRQIRTHMITRNAKNRTMDAPIDAAREYGSTSKMMRDAKSRRKAIDKQAEQIEKEAIDRLSAGRNRMFNELDYAERRSILEGEGINVEEMEQKILMERKLRNDRAKMIAKQKRSQHSFFNRMRRLFPSMRRTIGGYSIPMDNLRRTNSSVVYNSVSKAAWTHGKNKAPTAAVPNRFIVKPTGQVIPDTYQAKKVRNDAVDKYVEAPKKLPAIPNKFNKLKLLSPSVQKAYLEMRGEVARVCGARLNPFEQETHSKLSLKDRAAALEKAWKSHAYLMNVPQTPWYGDKMAVDQGRGINSPDNGAKVERELNDIYTYLEKQGVNPNSLTGDEHSDAVIASLLNDFEVESDLRSMQHSARVQAYTTDQILQIGAPTKDIPFFDCEMYDTDVDPFEPQPKATMVTVKHQPLGLDHFNTQAQALDPQFVPDGIRPPQGTGKAPKHWRFGPDHQVDFSKTQYTQLHRSIQGSSKAMKPTQNQAMWRNTHSGVGVQRTQTLEEVERAMNPGYLPSRTRRDKAHLDILMDKDLEVIDGVKSKKKKKKKQEKTDYFSDFNFSGSDKSKKNGSKKKHKKSKDSDKKKKSKPDPLLASYDDDERPIGMDLTESILRGVGDATRKRFSKAIKASKEGKLYSR